MANGFLERVNVVTTTINAIGALATSLIALYAPLEMLGLPTQQVRFALWSACGIFLIVLLFAAIRAVPKRSILRDPDAFTLRRELPAHLIGRTEEIDLLERTLGDEGLIFVEGESGVGKSALLRSGLAPRLAAGNRYLPVYVESLSGRDWAVGPGRALLPAFRAVLEDVAPKAASDLKNETLMGLVRATHDMGLVPVLILDQFDDYQLSHREHFLRSGAWLKANDLAARNTFWAEVRDLLKDEKIQLVVATRSDMASGLESARFIEPYTFRVERIEATFIRDLLQRLSGDNDNRISAIEAPDATWPELRLILLDDLTGTGSILPQQLKVALLGLRGLPRQHLTVAAYKACGRLRGLEANWVKAQIVRASDRSKLPASDVRRLLTALCDLAATTKARSLSLTALCNTAGVTDYNAATVALSVLQDGEVVRRSAREGSIDAEWRLDHDYIVGVVQHFERAANYAEARLAEGRKLLAAASGAFQKWDALLPLQDQLRIASDRVRGTFRYGQSRTYALMSVVRIAPAASFVVLGWFAYDWNRRDFANNELAERIAAGFDDSHALTQHEVRLLEELSLSNISVARGIVRRMLRYPGLADNFVVHQQAIMAALDLAADGDWAELAEAAEPLVEVGTGSEDPSVAYVFAMMLDRAGLAQEAAFRLIAAMQSATNTSESFFRLAAGLRDMAERLPPDAASRAASLLTAAIEQRATSGSAVQLPDVLRTIGSRMSSEGADDVAGRLLTAIELGRAGYRSQSTSDALGTIWSRMSSDGASRAERQLVAAIEASIHSDDALNRVSGTLSAVGHQLSQEATDRIATVLVNEMEANANDNARLLALGQGLGPISNRANPETIRRAAEILGAAIRRSANSPRIVSQIAYSFGPHRIPMMQDDARLAAEVLLKAMETATDNRQLAAQMALSLAAIAHHLPTDVIARAASHLVGPIEADEYYLPALPMPGVGLDAIWDLAPSDSVYRESTRILAAVEENASNTLALSALSMSLGAIANRAPPEVVGSVAIHLVTAIEKNTSIRGALYRLMAGLTSIRDGIPSDVAAQLAQRLATLIEANAGRAEIVSLGAAGIVRLASRLTSADALLLAPRLDSMLLQCTEPYSCHAARVAVQGRISEQRAIHFAHVAAADPLATKGASPLFPVVEYVIPARTNRSSGLDVFDLALQEQKAKPTPDGARVRGELRDLLQGRKTRREALLSPVGPALNLDPNSGTEDIL